MAKPEPTVEQKPEEPEKADPEQVDEAVPEPEMADAESKPESKPEEKAEEPELSLPEIFKTETKTIFYKKLKNIYKINAKLLDNRQEYLCRALCKYYNKNSGNAIAQKNRKRNDRKRSVKDRKSKSGGVGSKDNVNGGSSKSSGKVTYRQPESSENEAEENSQLQNEEMEDESRISQKISKISHEENLEDNQDDNNYWVWRM